jgi:hypothetical protein
VRGFTRRPLEKLVINPNPQKGGYPDPDRVTFLTGPNRDFPKWRRHQILALGYGLYPLADPMEIKFEVVAHTRTPLIIAEK